MATRQFDPLRTVTYRLSTTSPKQLPRITPSIANTLLDCQNVFSTPEDSRAKDSGDSILLHKYRTQISSLLNGKTVEGRWSAVVLIKTTIDIGGWETLRRSSPWVRGLLAILSKPDPPTTKMLCILTLTRIFCHTHEFPTLIKEITTPSLPAFLTSCLNLADPKTATLTIQQTQYRETLLPIVLASFCELLPNHPTIFRTFLSQIQSLLKPILAPTPSNLVESKQNEPSFVIKQEVVDVAQSVLALLHYCAPKSTASEEWRRMFLGTLNEAENTANRTFRAVLEDWNTIPGVNPPSANIITYDDEIVNGSHSYPELPEWSGIHAGCERLCGLINLVKQFIRGQTASAVSTPMGNLLNILFRVLSISALSKNGRSTGPRLNDSIGREERDGLFSELPNIQLAAIEALDTILERFSVSQYAICLQILDQIVWTFRQQGKNSILRTALYRISTRLCQTFGSAFTITHVTQLNDIIRSCCNDMLPVSLTEPEVQDIKPTSKGGAGNARTKQTQTLNADTLLGKSKSASTQSPTEQSAIYVAATNLLSTFLRKIPAHHIPQKLREIIDRTIILGNDENAMVASMINQDPRIGSSQFRSSILPLVARAFPENTTVESVIRPRMPMIKTNQNISAEDDEDNFQREDDDSIMPERDARNVTEQTEYSRDINGLPQESKSPANEFLTSKFQAPSYPEAMSQNQDSRSTIPGPSVADADQEPGYNAITNPLKRDAAHDPVELPETKRTQTHLSQNQTIENPAPFTTVMHHSISKPMSAGNEPMRPKSTSSKTTVASFTESEPRKGVQDDSDADDDFEIPAITMEPDTEDEAEDG